MFADKPQRVAIFSFKEDLHARLITELIKDAGHQCHHIATDDVAYQPSITWGFNSSHIRDVNDQKIAPDKLNTIWWRRVKGGQSLEEDIDDRVRSLISIESQTAMFGCVANSFSGRWVNEPMADARADNKLVQIHAARKIGWKVPQTMVSNSPEDVRDFVQGLGGIAIVKSVYGVPGLSIPTREITLADLVDDVAINACPAIYQELIPGHHHLRIHVFGKNILTAKIECSHLDWRPHLDSPMSVFQLPDSWANKCLQLLKSLGLSMGIIDAKINNSGDIIFLEINPQGQFLFFEPLLDIPLSKKMASFLIGAH